MRRVTILATGGTIAGHASSGADPSYRPGVIDVASLLGSVPGIKSLARIDGEQITQLASQDADETWWLTLAERVNRLFLKDEADGVVITHGTDTAEETGYFLHLTVNSSRPVVLTGAMRPASALSADGPLNLFNAVAVAAHPDANARGVMLVVNDDIHSAPDVTKSSTTDVQSFISPATGLLGTATYGQVRFTRRPTRLHTTSAPFSRTSPRLLPRVDIHYAYAGASPDLIDASVSRGARGIVVAGVGNGNFPASMARALEAAVRADVSVVRSSRVIAGDVGRNIEVDDDAAGFIASDRLSPQKGRILLQLCLAAGMRGAALQEAFYRY